MKGMIVAAFEQHRKPASIEKHQKAAVQPHHCHQAKAKKTIDLHLAGKPPYIDGKYPGQYDPSGTNQKTASETAGGGKLSFTDQPKQQPDETAEKKRRKQKLKSWFSLEQPIPKNQCAGNRKQCCKQNQKGHNAAELPLP